jgi:hypothetical protein
MRADEQEQAEKGAEAQQHEDEALVVAPGVTGTKTMWKGAVSGFVIGVAIGVVIAVVAGLLLSYEGRMLAIVAIAGAAGGGVFGLVAGGYLLPTQKHEAEREEI